MKSFFSTKHIHVTLDGKTILENIDFNIQRGEFLYIVGPNGSGKSTLLKALVAEPSLETISYLSQQSSRIWPLCGKDFVLTARRVQKPFWAPLTKEDTEFALECLSQMNALHLAKQNIQTLSAGEFQRVRIARALMQKASVILLDEPFNNLELGHQLEFMKHLETLNKHGITFVLVDHDLGRVIEDRKRTLVLHQGKLVKVIEKGHDFPANLLSDVFHLEIQSRDRVRFQKVYR